MMKNRDTAFFGVCTWAGEKTQNKTASGFCFCRYYDQGFELLVAIWTQINK